MSVIFNLEIKKEQNTPKQAELFRLAANRNVDGSIKTCKLPSWEGKKQFLWTPIVFVAKKWAILRDPMVPVSNSSYLGGQGRTVILRPVWKRKSHPTSVGHLWDNSFQQIEEFPCKPQNTVLLWLHEVRCALPPVLHQDLGFPSSLHSLPALSIMSTHLFFI